MVKYNIVGAFDRHNYGDILFPLIHAGFIKKNNENADIRYFSLTSVDLENIGGVKTDTLKNLLREELLPNDRIIMCGGDILTVDWISMLGHLSSEKTYFILKIIRKLFGVTIANNFVRKVWNQKSKYPYIITHKEANCKVYYTGVGGSGFELSNSKYIHDIPKELSFVDSISVRENITREYLKNAGVNCKLIPDTALIMSDYYPIDVISSREWKKNVKVDNDFSFDNYIVFQCARANGEKKESIIVDEIKEIYKKRPLSIMLLPIGRATGHEDHIVLERLHKMLSEEGIPVGIQNDAHVLTIMATLANSKAYIGTSLHGAITSYSFGRKVCAISTNRVVKLRGFLEAWMDKRDYNISPDLSFSNGFLELCEGGYDINNKGLLENQKGIIIKNMSDYI